MTMMIVGFAVTMAAFLIGIGIGLLWRPSPPRFERIPTELMPLDVPLTVPPLRGEVPVHKSEFAPKPKRESPNRAAIVETFMQAKRDAPPRWIKGAASEPRVERPLPPPTMAEEPQHDRLPPLDWGNTR